MNRFRTLGRKLMSLAIASVAVCFSHGSCSSVDDGFFYDSVEYVEEWYEDTVYYFDDDYYYYDDCGRCDGYGWDSWFDWF